MEHKEQIELFLSNKSLIERDFCTHEFALEEGGNGGDWKALFHRLENSLVFTTDMVLYCDPEFKSCNRYRSILPYDNQSRVSLGEDRNNYINASFVSIEETDTTYVLTQGPMKNTTNHFWQMVWEQGTVGIVMLCRCVENGREKCEQYWPAKRGMCMVAGTYTIETQGCTWSASHSLSFLLLHNSDTDESRKILHYSYTDWPDFGVPRNVVLFLEFLMEVRDSGVMAGPVVVHCSGGVGRSGVFTMTDMALSWLERGKSYSNLDLKELLLCMRRQRLGLVQTPEQLRFAYVSILTAAHDLMGYGQSILDLEREVKCWLAVKEHCVMKSVPGPEAATHHYLPSYQSGEHMSLALSCAPCPPLHAYMPNHSLTASLSSIPSYSSCTYSLSSASLSRSLSYVNTSPAPSILQTHITSRPQTHTTSCSQAPTSSAGSPGAVMSDSKMKTKRKSWFKGLKKLFRRKKKRKK